jgi:hypothetical protein
MTLPDTLRRVVGAPFGYWVTYPNGDETFLYSLPTNPDYEDIPNRYVALYDLRTSGPALLALAGAAERAEGSIATVMRVEDLELGSARKLGTTRSELRAALHALDAEGMSDRTGGGG